MQNENDQPNHEGEQAARLEHPSGGPTHAIEIGQVDQGIGRDNEIGALVLAIERIDQIRNREPSIKMFARCLLDHRPRQVETDDVLAASNESLGGKTGAATEVEHAAEADRQARALCAASTASRKSLGAQ